MHKLMLSLLCVVSFTLLFFYGGEARQREMPFTNACHFNQINSLAPAQATKFEAGQMEVWDHMSPELRCAGVTVVRVTLEPNSIFLPAFFSPPSLAYVVQGEGVMGTIASGCPETYEEVEGSVRGEGDRPRRFEDMHQKLDNFRRGDVFASLAGVSQWWYNRGDSDVVLVIVLDVTNRENQLDQVPRMFQLAGSRQQEEQQPLNWPSGKNVFSGFDAKIIAEVLKIDIKIAKKLQNPKDNRGNIVRANGPLDLQSRQWQQNGIEETYCTARLHENIDDPERADFFSTRAGRISTLNSLNLPVLRLVRLNAIRGYLYSGGMVLPQWTANAHTVLYVTGGTAKIQVVDDNGKSVFNEQVGQGQVLVVPQGFAVVKIAGETGFEWVSFKTNDYVYVNTLSGSTSYLRGVPLDVIKASYDVTEEQAKVIKFSQQETMLAMTSSSSS